MSGNTPLVEEQAVDELDGPAHELIVHAAAAPGALGYQLPPAKCSCGRWATPAVDPADVHAGYADHLIAEQIAADQHAEHEQQIRLPLAELATIARSWVALHTDALDRIAADLAPDDVRGLVLADTTHQDIQRLAELVGEVSEIVDRLSQRPHLATYAAQLTEAAVIIQNGELALTDVVLEMPGYAAAAVAGQMSPA